MTDHDAAQQPPPRAVLCTDETGEAYDAAKLGTPRPSAAQSYADAAERHLESHYVTDDTRAITYALLSVGATIEAATDRLTVDLDALAAALDGRLQDITAGVDPSFAVPPRVPWRYRLVALLRPPGPGWHDGGGQ
jgi:hypothetical protein